jgi:hypothetical protein
MSSSPIDLAGILDAAPGSMSDAELCAWVAQVEQAGRLIDAARVRAAGEVAERSRRELGRESLARRHGTQCAAQLLERLARISAADASRRIRLAADTAPRVSLVGEVLPARFDVVAQAFHGGEIGVDAALAIVRNLAAAEGRASIDGLERAETDLVGEAKQTSADLVAVQARAWRGALDPDGSAPRDNELRGRRRFVIGREVGGMTPFWGEADPLSASQLRVWLGERTAPGRQPRFLDLDDPAFDAVEPDSGIDDPRTREQRGFDVLMGLLQAGVRADALTNTPLQSAANVMVVVTADVLASGKGTAWDSDVTEPISAVAAGVVACDAGIQKVVVGPFGQPLALGRRERYFSAAQRKVLAVRDGGCAWPECTSPPAWTHAHHVIPWSQDGPTDVDNGVLLCAFHHHLVHEGEFEIRMMHGIPHLRSPLRLDYTQRWVRMGRHRVPVAA